MLKIIARRDRWLKTAATFCAVAALPAAALGAIGGPGLIQTGTNSVSQTQTITNLSLAQRIDIAMTQILGRLNGGAPLFDQSYNAAFGDPAVQSGLTDARLAITAAGGPGVVIFGPTLINRTQTATTASVSSDVVTGTTLTIATSVVGPQATPAIVQTGDRGLCSFGGSTSTIITAQGNLTLPPSGCKTGVPFVVPAGTQNFLTNSNTDTQIQRTTTTTNTVTTAEVYELNGTVQPVGVVHTAVQSGLFDMGSRLLRRMGDEGSPGLFGEPTVNNNRAALAAYMPVKAAPAGFGPQNSYSQGSLRGWAEAYGVRARTDDWRGIPGDRRDMYGFAGGASFAPVPWLLTGFGIDQGRVNIDVPGALERANIDLTQFAGVARVSTGAFALALSGTYGFGSANTTRTLLGVSSTSYDVQLWGGLAEASYRFDVGPWRIVPKAGFDYVRIENNNFSETGVFGLIGNATNADRSRVFAGLEVGRSFHVGSAAQLDLTGYARAITVIDGGARIQQVAFISSPTTTLTVSGIMERGTGVDFGAQARLGLSSNVGLYAVYDGRVRDSYTSHAGTAGVKVFW